MSSGSDAFGGAHAINDQMPSSSPRGTDSLATNGLAFDAEEDDGNFVSLPADSWMPAPLAPPRTGELPRRPPVAPMDKSRQILSVAAIGLCSVLLAGGAFFIFLRWVSPTKSAQQNMLPTVVGDLPAGVGAPTAEPGHPNPQLADAQPGNAQPASVKAANAQPANVEGGNTANIDQPSIDGSVLDSTASNLPVRSSPSGQVDAGASNAAIGPSAVSPAPSSGAVNSAPGGIAANALGPSGVLASDAAVAPVDSSSQDLTDESPAVRDTLPPGLQNFASIFDQSLVPVLSDATVPLGAATDAGEDTSPSEEVPSRAVVTALDLPETVAQKMELKISGLLIQDRSLSEVLSTLTIATDIAMTVDFDSLAAAGIDRNLSIRYRSTQPSTVSQVLEQIAQEHNLVLETLEKSFVVARGSGDQIRTRLANAWPIDDLVADDPQSDQLLSALRELLPELSDRVAIVDGTIQTDLAVDNPLLWFQVGRVLETWRSLRKNNRPVTSDAISNEIESAVTPSGAARLPAWPVAQAQATAVKEISQSLLPESLALSWQRLSNEAGMACWIDWPSLESSQLSAKRVAMTVSRGRSFGHLLQHYASKFQVAFALEDAQTLWVTSPEMHRVQPRLFVLPIADRSVEQWRKELAPLTPLSPTDGTPMLRVIPSPDGGFVFVRCCRPLIAAP